ncbi:MAG: hypothetical protein Q8O88_06385 [bacterium]|nr:hypothetical protein [bacterium]
MFRLGQERQTARFEINGVLKKLKGHPFRIDLTAFSPFPSVARFRTGKLR